MNNNDDSEEVNVEEEVDVEDYEEEDDEEEEDEEEDGVSKSQNENEEEYEEDDDDDDDDEEEENSNQLNQSSLSRKSKYNFSLNENMLYQEVLQVNCNSVVAELHKKKFGSGGKGLCIRLVVRKESSTTTVDTTSSSVIEERWMTPIEFENYCGKGNCRDWKRTIKVGGQPLLALLDARILICHAVSCSCGICNRNETLVGPIRPFMKYRRRKRDEILAQNAYKKFLSLKPPTLINNNNINNNNESINSPSLNTNTSSCLVVASNTNNTNNINNINNNMTASYNTNSNSSLLSNSPSHNQHNHSSPTLNRSGFIISSSNNHEFFPAHHLKNENGADDNDDLTSLMSKMKDQDEKKWSTLEQLANTLINQTKLLQTSIEQAKRESELNWKYLIEKAAAATSTRVNAVSKQQRRVGKKKSVRESTD